MLDIAQEAVRRALAQGATDAECTISEGDEFDATVMVVSPGASRLTVSPGARVMVSVSDEIGAAGGAGIHQPRSWENDETCVVNAEVAGFGDVVYRFVERHGSAAQFQPGAIEMEPGAAAGADDDLLRTIDHAAVCVPAGELDSTIAFHEQVFGFTVTFQEYIELGDQGMMSKVVQSPSGGVTFTIIQPDLTRQAGQIDDFLAWHDGAGVQHIAFLTHDIVHAVQTYADRGVGFAVTPSSYYDMLTTRLGATDIAVEGLRPLGILVDRDHWGQMYQIFAKSTHIRRTYFHELIERRGARTFGMSNIPALYAAKDRELAEIREMTGTTHT